MHRKIGDNEKINQMVLVFIMTQEHTLVFLMRGQLRADTHTHTFVYNLASSINLTLTAATLLPL